VKCAVPKLMHPDRYAELPAGLLREADVAERGRGPPSNDRRAAMLWEYS
jgi:hypothetical protein